jgi:tubulin polyglutamylase TTLL4
VFTCVYRTTVVYLHAIIHVHKSCLDSLDVIHVICFRYISNPYLINENKFDLRVYVYVTSIEPLTIYVYRNGLVRFATIRYSQAVKTLSNRFIHLTNYSVNKKSNEFLPNSDETQCVGHKWGLLALWDYMETHLKIDPRPVWDKIQDLVIKTILSSESHIASLVKANCPHSRSVHELFGFDIMLDSRLKPWLLEVNVSPR